MFLEYILSIFGLFTLSVFAVRAEVCIVGLFVLFSVPSWCREAEAGAQLKSFHPGLDSSPWNGDTHLEGCFLPQ